MWGYLGTPSTAPALRTAVLQAVGRELWVPLWAGGIGNGGKLREGPLRLRRPGRAPDAQPETVLCHQVGSVTSTA